MTVGLVTLDKIIHYETTADECKCLDRVFRPWLEACKHMKAIRDGLLPDIRNSANGVMVTPASGKPVDPAKPIELTEEDRKAMVRFESPDLSNVLWTVGYGKRTAEEFAEIVADDIKAPMVLDIRFSPHSRKKGLSGGPLQRRFKKTDSSYLHCSLLGNINYKSEMGGIVLKNEPFGLGFLGDLLAKSDVVIFCACQKVDGCHRRYVANRMQEKFEGLEVKHYE